MAKTMLEVERELSPNLVTPTELYQHLKKGGSAIFEDDDGNLHTITNMDDASWFASYNINLGTVYYPTRLKGA